MKRFATPGCAAKALRGDRVIHLPDFGSDEVAPGVGSAGDSPVPGDPPTGMTGEWLLKPTPAFIRMSSVRRLAGRDRPVACATHFLDGGGSEVRIDGASGGSKTSTPVPCPLSTLPGHFIRPAATFSPSDAEKGNPMDEGKQRGCCRFGAT